MDIPSLAQELERKTIETIERFVRQFEQGKLTKAQFASAVETTFQIVSGLVPENIILALEVCNTERDTTFDIRRAFWRRQTGELYTVVRHSKGERLTVTKFVVGKAVPIMTHKEFSNATIPAHEAAKAQDHLCEKLIEQGYQEV